MMNLIPFNSVEDTPYQRPEWEQAAAMARQLHQRGILTKLRHSAGQDVDGGCGQLRARALGEDHPALPMQPQPQTVRIDRRART